MRALLAAVALCVAVVTSWADSASRWVDVGGVSIHYLDSGEWTPGSPVLLMVHGWCGSAEDFRQLLGLLPAGTRGVSVDLPGSGLSGKPDAVYDLPYFVGVLWALHDTLGLGTMILVGHSMGAQFVLHLAAQHPEAVAKLVLIDPYGLREEQAPFQGLLWMGPLVDVVFHLNTRLFIEWGVRANVFYRPTDQMVQNLADSTGRSILDYDGARAAGRVTRNVIGHDSVDDILPTLIQPALVVWGDHDKVLAPAWAERFVSLLPRASIAIVKDSGHMPMVEKPRETAELVDEFLGR